MIFDGLVFRAWWLVRRGTAGRGEKLKSLRIHPRPSLILRRAYRAGKADGTSPVSTIARRTTLLTVSRSVSQQRFGTLKSQGRAPRHRQKDTGPLPFDSSTTRVARLNKFWIQAPLFVPLGRWLHRVRHSRIAR